MSAGAISVDSVVKPSGLVGVTNAAVPSKPDFGAVGAPNWAKLLGDDAKGTVFASRSTMQSAVEKASSEGLISSVQAEHLNEAIDKLPSQERPTYAEAAKLLSDFGLDVTRSVTFTTDTTGNSVVSFVDFGGVQAPNWENLIAHEAAYTDRVSGVAMRDAVDSAEKRGLIGPNQAAYIKDAIDMLDTSSNPPNLKEAEAQLNAIGRDISKKVDAKTINAIPGTLAVTDPTAGTAGTPNWDNLLKSAAPTSSTSGLGSSHFSKAIDAARAAGVINSDQQTFLKDAVASLPTSAVITVASGAKLLNDIGLDVKKTVEITMNSAGAPVVSFADMGGDQAPNWQNLITNEAASTDRISGVAMKAAVDTAQESGLIGPNQANYIKDAIDMLDTSSNPPNLKEAEAQLNAIGLDINMKVDAKTINAIPGSLAVADPTAGTAGTPSWENLLKSAAPTSSTSGLGSSHFGKAIDAARAAGVITSDQQTFLKEAVASLPTSAVISVASGAKLLNDVGLDVKKTVEVTMNSAGAPVVSFVDMGSDQAPNWKNLIAREASNINRISSVAMNKAVDSAQEKGFIGPKQTNYIKAAIAQLDTSSNPPNLQVAAAQLQAIGLVVTNEVDTDAIEALATRKP